MDDNQNQAQNINQEIDTTTFIIHGKMRNGKTLLGILMSLKHYGRIYSNVNIYENGKSIVNFIEDFKKIQNIRFSYKPGILIIDEAGINSNSKDAFSKENRIMQEVLFLIGKKNLSLIWISQRYDSIDINARVLADYAFECKKVKRENNHPIFKVKKQRQKGSKLITLHEYYVDTITLLKGAKITYNQLEESKIKKVKTSEEEENEKNLI